MILKQCLNNLLELTLLELPHLALKKYWVKLSAKSSHNMTRILFVHRLTRFPYFIEGSSYNLAHFSSAHDLNVVLKLLIKAF